MRIRGERSFKAAVRWVIRAVAAVGLLWPAAGVRSAALRAEPSASLEPMQGLVQVRAARAAGDAWETVSERRLVAEGDWIRTDAAGRALLTFFEGVECEILPETQVRVSRLSLAADQPPEIGLRVWVGDTLHRVEALADPQARYEVETPNAAVAVRGTEFWVSVSWLRETQVSARRGTVSVRGIDLQGRIGPEALLGAGRSVRVSPEGVIGRLEALPPWPDRPPVVPLAPKTCGNNTCEPGEAPRCAADCTALPNCGDGICGRAEGEGPVTCAEDCIPWSRGDAAVMLEFLWGNMTCVFVPNRPVVRSLTMHWGIGCFDSQASAQAHPHPADYQLLVDGREWVMSGLQQRGPENHAPYCPWGWGFQIGPVTLPPGRHHLTLIQTTTDTWHEQSGGHDAGEVAELSCDVVFRP